MSTQQAQGVTTAPAGLGWPDPHPVAAPGLGWPEPGRTTPDRPGPADESAEESP
ncbi:MAG TPA: hypothetical protein VLV82_01090 [Candidatus Angelobacter sp.]|nr:hypothetical protein [Candidatus Angelobacter sp.]